MKYGILEFDFDKNTGNLLPVSNVMPINELEDENFLRCKYESENTSATKISGIIGCSISSVYKALRKFNIKIRSPGRPILEKSSLVFVPKVRKKMEKRFKKLGDKEFLISKYEEGLNLREISELIGCTKQRVYSVFKEFGIVYDTKFKRNPVLFDESIIRQKYIDENMEIKELSGLLHCSQRSLKMALSSFNIHRPKKSREGIPNIRKRQYPLLHDKNYLHNEYITKRKSVAKIAEMIGCSPVAVYHALKKINIITRCYKKSQNIRIRNNKILNSLLKIKEGNKDSKIAKENGVSRKTIYRWKREYKLEPSWEVKKIK